MHGVGPESSPSAQTFGCCVEALGGLPDQRRRSRCLKWPWRPSHVAYTNAVAHVHTLRYNHIAGVPDGPTARCCSIGGVYVARYPASVWLT